MPHLLLIFSLNILSIYLSQSIPGKPVVNSIIFAALSLAVFVFRDNLGKLLSLPECLSRHILGVVAAYCLSGSYIFIWAFLKALNVALPGCSPHC
jgi:hypothetical protein